MEKLTKLRLSLSDEQKEQFISSLKTALETKDMKNDSEKAADEQ